MVEDGGFQSPKRKSHPKVAFDLQQLYLLAVILRLAHIGNLVPVDRITIAQAFWFQDHPEDETEAKSDEQIDQHIHVFPFDKVNT